MTQDTALVTGGAGFIGSHVVDLLLARGHEVVVVDNLCTGEQRKVNSEAYFVELDIRDDRLADVFHRERPLYVFHLAAQASVPRSVQAPAEDADINVKGSLNLLQLSVRYGVEKFIYSSSGGAVYGEPQRLPCDEGHPLRPMSPYGASKLSVEFYLPVYHSLGGLSYTTLRYGNVYGPRQDPYGEAGVVAIFINKMLKGEQPTIFGDGEQQRDFVYVEDVARSNLAVLSKGSGEAFNIGSGVGSTVNQMFSLLKAATGYRGAASYGPPRSGDVYKTYLDVSKAQQELGWSPQVPLKRGLERTVEHMRAQP